MKKIATNRNKWIPKHETFIQPVSNIYDLVNSNTGNNLMDYNSTTRGLQGVIQEAIDGGFRLRTFGGEWSFSNVAGTNGLLLNTKPLNIKFKMSKGSILDSSDIEAENLYFVQCGNSILEISDMLELDGKSFKTTGASNGQTIAGALSTGTHGAAIDIGSFSNFVVGLHLVLGPNKHIYLERRTNKIVRKVFADKLNTVIVRDDELFNAALVNFGSIGIIHGVMIEVTDKFLYDSFRVKIPFKENIKELMTDLDFSKAKGLPKDTIRPYHFQLVVNPYNIGGGIYCSIMYKKKYSKNYTKPKALVDGYIPGDESIAVLSKLTMAIGKTIPVLMNQLIKSQYPTNDEAIVGTHAEIFSNTELQGKLLSCAICVDMKNAKKILDLFLAYNNHVGPFAGLVAFRYLRGTDATLGFTKFKNSCVFEMDGLFNDHTRKFCLEFTDLLMDKNLAFTLHWGKEFPVDKQKFEYMYPKEKIESWITSRNTLLENTQTMRVFENKIMEDLGLTKINTIV